VLWRRSIYCEGKINNIEEMLILFMQLADPFDWSPACLGHPFAFADALLVMVAAADAPIRLAHSSLIDHSGLPTSSGCRLCHFH
jgi:hypothetical protein